MLFIFTVFIYLCSLLYSKEITNMISSKIENITKVIVSFNTTIHPLVVEVLFQQNGQSQNNSS